MSYLSTPRCCAKNLLTHLPLKVGTPATKFPALSTAIHCSQRAATRESVAPPTFLLLTGLNLHLAWSPLSMKEYPVILSWQIHSTAP